MFIEEWLFNILSLMQLGIMRKKFNLMSKLRYLLYNKTATEEKKKFLKLSIAL